VEPEGYYLACGFSGNGFKINPAVGKCMAEMIVDGEMSTLDISPFHLERFKKHKLPVGEFPHQDTWLLRDETYSSPTSNDFIMILWCK